MLSRAGRYARNGFAVVGLVTLGTGYAVTAAQRVSVLVNMHCHAPHDAGRHCNRCVAHARCDATQRMRKDATRLPEQFVLELGEQMQSVMRNDMQ
jgi:hypothetical protein